MKRRRSREEDDKGRREVQEEEPGKARRRRKNPTGDMLFGCFCSEVLFVDLYRGPARLIAQHFINREQKKKKTGRCVAGCHSHSSLLYSTTRLIIYHNPSYSSYRIVVAVALLLVLFCRRVRLTASFACACRRFVTRKSFTVSRPTMSEPLRVCGRPGPCAPCAPRSTGTRSARTARRLLQRGLPCTPKHVKSPRRLFRTPV